MYVGKVLRETALNYDQAKFLPSKSRKIAMSLLRLHDWSARPEWDKCVAAKKQIKNTMATISEDSPQWNECILEKEEIEKRMAEMIENSAHLIKR